MRLLRGRLGVALAALVLLLLGVGWYYSSQALEPGGLRVLDVEVAVHDVTDTTITITDVPDARLAVVGVQAADGDGYLQLTGEARAVACADEQGCLVRDFRVLVGDTPAVGDRGWMDPYAFPLEHPELAVGAPPQILQVEVDGGLAPAWWWPPTSGDLVVVGIHGRGANRAELLRLASGVVARGHGMLVPTYRGDGVAPDPEDGLGRFGAAEWLDVAMAMLHDEVPPDAPFVLAGMSQGSGVAASLLEQADVARRVVGAVMDSPLIDLDATMELQAHLAGIPAVLTRPVLESAYLVSRFRGFNFASGQHVDFLAESDLPILLFHGPDDTYVPGEPSDALAQRRPDVDYRRTAGVDHVRFWNHDPSSYALAVDAFLTQVHP